MKRLIAAAATALLLSAGAASAADVSVSIGPELQKQTKAYGPREVEMLRKDLAKTIDRALTRGGATAPQRVDLVLESATPNRPTFNQLSAETGLSLSSIGVGGAAISGTVTGVDGVARPISYRWRESDLHRVTGYATWTDAEIAFQGLASQLARGKTPNAGPYRPDLASAAAFDSRHRFN